MSNPRIVLLIGACFFWLFPGTEPVAAPPEKTLGVGFTTYMGTGDATQKGMHKLLGQMPNVKHILHSPTHDQFFRQLLKYRDAGQQIDFLAIASHGSAAQPFIEFSDSNLFPQDVDLASMRGRLERYRKALEKRRDKGLDTARIEAQTDKLERRMELLESVSDVMAPDAKVVLINCSTAATPEGKEFVKNLGRVFMSKNGGTIYASKQDVLVDQVKSVADKLWVRFRTGRWAAIGDFFAAGDWDAVEIKPSTETATTAEAGQQDSSNEPILLAQGTREFTAAQLDQKWQTTKNDWWNIQIDVPRSGVVIVDPGIVNKTEGLGCLYGGGVGIRKPGEETGRPPGGEFEAGTYFVDFEVIYNANIPAYCDQTFNYKVYLQPGTHEERCETYAQTAVSQFKESRKLQCDVNGPRWSDNYQGHFEWCMSVDNTSASIETEARVAALDECRP